MTDIPPTGRAVPEGTSPVQQHASGVMPHLSLGSGADQATGSSGGSAVETSESSEPDRIQDGDLQPSLLKLLSRHKRPYISITLAVIGLAILPLAFWVLPSGDQPPTPSAPLVSIGTNAPVNDMTYQVVRKGPSRYLLSVILQTSSVVTPKDSKDNTANVEIFLPRRWEFGPCVGSKSACVGRPAAGVPKGRVPYPGTVRVWHIGFPYSTTEARLVIFIKGRDFGYTSNSVTENVAMPQVEFSDPVNLRLSVVYQDLPSLENYDWSSFPPTTETRTYAGWFELIMNGNVQARMATGIDHGAQTRENRDTFLAGALVGIAGSALIGAAQEAIHLWADASNAPADRRLRVRRRQREKL